MEADFKSASKKNHSRCIDIDLRKHAEATVCEYSRCTGIDFRIIKADALLSTLEEQAQLSRLTDRFQTRNHDIWDESPSGFAEEFNLRV